MPPSSSLPSPASSPADWQNGPVAVLVSGGLDSAILVGELSRTSPRVYPVYVRFGLVWEQVEEDALRNFLGVLNATHVAPLQVFHLPVEPVYGSHWSTTGHNTPGYDSADAEVFLPGRNLLLFAQAGVWCHLQHIPTIALGVLAGNPFPDSTPEYFAALQQVIGTAVGNSLQIVAPYRQLTKIDVLRRGAGFPLEETLSCIRPVGKVHCGACNKCAERQRAFQEAVLPDPTRYATAPQ